MKTSSNKDLVFLQTTRKIVPIALANGITLLRQKLHIETGLPVSKPNMIYVMINNVCNLRCLYCDIWKCKGEHDLTTGQWIQAFDELLSWTRHPKLNISGGEPFVRKDIFEILEYVVKKGAIVGVVTNGWALKPEMAQRVVALGLSNLNISIDSLDPEVCDMMRGREGHTKSTIETILRVMEEIKRQQSSMKVYLKVVVSGSNATSLVDIVHFAQEHGISGVMFQPLEAVFSREVDYGTQWHKNTPLWPQDVSEIEKATNDLIALKKDGAPIANPISHMLAWPEYFKDPIAGVQGQVGGDNLQQKKIPCRIGHTHLYINSDGTVKLCWSFPSIGNVLHDSVKKKWTGEQAKDLRESIARCTAPCTKTCLLDRGLSETVKSFVTLMKPYSKT